MYTIFLIVTNFALKYTFCMDEALFQKSFLHKKTGYPFEEYPA
jgi:hypothetical protein